MPVPPLPASPPLKINQKVFLCNALFPSEPKHLTGDVGPPPPGISPFFYQPEDTSGFFMPAFLRKIF